MLLMWSRNCFMRRRCARVPVGTLVCFHGTIQKDQIKYQPGSLGADKFWVRRGSQKPAMNDTFIIRLGRRNLMQNLLG